MTPIPEQGVVIHRHEAGRGRGLEDASLRARKGWWLTGCAYRTSCSRASRRGSSTKSKGSTHVCYATSSKPPATIEWGCAGPARGAPERRWGLQRRHTRSAVAGILGEKSFDAVATVRLAGSFHVLGPRGFEILEKLGNLVLGNIGKDFKSGLFHDAVSV